MLVPRIVWQVLASAIMTKSVTTCAPGDTMGDALSLMKRMRYKALPVVGSDGTFLGMLK
jgi:CBS domain-containing protein